jgi:hypothetical protein
MTTPRDEIAQELMYVVGKERAEQLLAALASQYAELLRQSARANYDEITEAKGTTWANGWLRGHDRAALLIAPKAQRDAACHAVEGPAGEEGADPGTILDRLEIALPGTEAKPAVVEQDTLPAWLYQRFAVIHGCAPWDQIDDGQRAYWEHQARAVRRAVERNGFNPAAAPVSG